MADALFLACLLASGQAQARGSMSTERPWASEHIEGLPADIRQGIVARERACGNAAAAGHYFAVSIEAGGQRFISLHFEDFACRNRAAVCNGGGCLHEVYMESRGRHRLAFSARARDLRLIKEGGVAGIEVNYGASGQFFRWDGTHFVAASAGSQSR
jgi:hypothetical protein